jgi:adenylate cyclase
MPMSCRFEGRSDDEPVTSASRVCESTHMNAPTVRSLVGMRVPRTFTFVDLSGFTNYTAAFGDDAAGRILSAFRTLCREIASEQGVRIAKWLGDGAMLVSTEQASALVFALELENRAAEVCAPLALRVGIATGHALLFEGDDYIGSAVNMASRLCDAAGPFEVLMPTMQIERLPEGVIATPHGELELRGFPGPVDVVELSGQPAAVMRYDTGELWTRTPFGV